MKFITTVRDLLERMRAAADAFADNRQGRNLCYALSDSVLRNRFFPQ